MLGAVRRLLHSLVVALALAAGARADCVGREPGFLSADLGPVYRYLEDRGLDTRGLRAVRRCVAVLYRPLPTSAAALYIPYLGLDEIHVSPALRGTRTGPEGTELDLGADLSERHTRVLTLIHELAHAEYDVRARDPGTRSHEPRLDRQYRDVRALRAAILERPHPSDRTLGVVTWPWYRAQEMTAYFVEDVLGEVLDRLDTLFWVNRLNVDRLIQSAADRERIRGRLFLAAGDPLAARLLESDPVDAGGRPGTSFFDGQPILHEVPPEMRRRLARDVLALGLPRSPSEMVAHAEALDTPWSREHRRLVAEARDERVARLASPAAATGALTRALARLRASRAATDPDAVARLVAGRRLRGQRIETWPGDADARRRHFERPEAP